MDSIRVDLTKEELENLVKKHKKIGEGTEGICLKHGSEIYKIHKRAFEIPISKNYIDASYDDDGVRIFNKEELRQKTHGNERIIQYTDKEGTRLLVEQALKRVIERGVGIKGTQLPQKIIYVDGIAKGYVYPYYKHTSTIYKAYTKSFKTRLMICRELLLNVKELIDNYVYPIDLCQKNPYRLFDRNYANVLLSLGNKPIIIDLDGKSAIYTEKHDEKYERITNYSLSNLIFEIMSKEDIQDAFKEDDIDAVIEYLSALNVNYSIIMDFIDANITTEEIEDALKQIELRR